MGTLESGVTDLGLLYTFCDVEVESCGVIRRSVSELAAIISGEFDER
jgi:hypothetical protein